MRLASGGTFFQELAQAIVDHRFDNAFHFAVSQLGLGLTFELGLGKLHADDADQAFANVVARQVIFEFFEEIVRNGVVVQRAGQRGLEADQVRAALVGVDVVGEGKDLFLIAVVVLQGDLKIDSFLDSLKVDNLVVERGLVLVEMLDERNDSAGVVKVVSLLRALIFDRDEQALVQKREFAKTLRKGIEIEFGRFEDPGVGLES